MSLLPSKPDTSAATEDADPRVIGVDSDEADDVISALSSETARKLLAELHEEPAPPSELSDRVGTSLQNAQYHLQKLESAGAVSVVDTAYSAKGREMDVYAPSDQPLVIFAGDEDKTTGLKAALSRLLGGAGLLALGSVVVQTLYGQTDREAGAAAPAAGGNGNGNGGDTAGGNGDGGGAVGGNGNGNGGGVAGNDDAGGVTETVTPDPETTSGGDVGIFGEEVRQTTTERAAETAANGTDYTMAMRNQTVTNATNVTEDGTRLTAETVATVSDAARDGAVQAADAGAAAVPPGLLFFAGGALVLALWLVVWYARR